MSNRFVFLTEPSQKKKRHIKKEQRACAAGQVCIYKAHTQHQLYIYKVGNGRSSSGSNARCLLGEMSELQATLEFSLELCKFYNVDLFQRGYANFSPPLKHLHLSKCQLNYLRSKRLFLFSICIRFYQIRTSLRVSPKLPIKVEVNQIRNRKYNISL